MTTIKRTKPFRKNYRRVKSHHIHGKDVDALLEEVRQYFLEKRPLPAKYKDHRLKGNLSDYRECHLKTDLLLMYQWSADGETVFFSRLGSHTELFD